MTTSEQSGLNFVPKVRNCITIRYLIHDLSVENQSIILTHTKLKSFKN